MPDGSTADDGPRNVDVLQVPGPGRVAWVPVENGPLADGAVRVDSVCAGISAGTELTLLKGTNPALTRVWDADLGIFRPGPAAGPAAGPAPAADPAAAPYPVRRLGYMQVGRVVVSRTPHIPAGALVAATYGQASGADLHPLRDRVVVLPSEMDPVLGVWVAHMGPICVNGLLHATADLFGPAAVDVAPGVRGRTVLVTGAGVVGLLTGLLAAWSGAADVVVADPTPARLAAARRLGLATVDSGESDVGIWAKQRWRHAAGDRGADVVFQCRGQAAGLATALRALRPQGTVVDLAFYPGGADEVRLGEEFHHNGLRLVCAQIGRVPRGAAHLWDRERMSAVTLDLLRDRGADLRAALVTDLVPAADAPAFYADLAAGRRHALQAVLTWPDGVD